MQFFEMWFLMYLKAISFTKLGVIWCLNILGNMLFQSLCGISQVVTLASYRQVYYRKSFERFHNVHLIDKVTIGSLIE